MFMPSWYRRVFIVTLLAMAPNAGADVINAGSVQTSAQQDKINGERGANIHGQSSGSSDSASSNTSTSDAGSTSTSTTPAPGRGSQWAAAPAGYSEAMVETWASAYTKAHGAGYKFVYLPPELASNKDTANIMRVAMAKAWNHLSWLKDLDIPDDISGGAGLAFALNTNKVWGDRATVNWGFIANCTPKRNIEISPAPVGDCATFDASKPVSIPRFVFNATNGGPYANIQQTPPDFDSFTQKYNLGSIKYVSTHKEAIVCGPRIIAYRPVTINGVDTWYAFTTDEFFGRDGGNIRYTNAPTDNDQRETGSLNDSPTDSDTAVASEWWIQMPNGFMYWGIHGEGSQERGRAETPFAIDPANWKQDDILATGRSCITCHAAGIQSAHSDDNFAGHNGWTTNADLQAFYKPIRGKFQAAMQTLVQQLSDSGNDVNSSMVNGTIEPIAKAIAQIEGPYQAGENDCSFFCNGKYGPERQNLCETLPTR